jgi:hypothetical protein
MNVTLIKYRSIILIGWYLICLSLINPSILECMDLSSIENQVIQMTPSVLEESHIQTPLAVPSNLLESFECYLDYVSKSHLQSFDVQQLYQIEQALSYIQRRVALAPNSCPSIDPNMIERLSFQVLCIQERKLTNSLDNLYLLDSSHGPVPEIERPLEFCQSAIKNIIEVKDARLDTARFLGPQGPHLSNQIAEIKELKEELSLRDNHMRFLQFRGGLLIGFLFGLCAIVAPIKSI